MPLKQYIVTIPIVACFAGLSTFATDAVANIQGGANSLEKSTQLTISQNRLILAQQGILTEKAGISSSAVTPSKSRVLIIQNVGDVPAMDVTYKIEPALPMGTQVTPQACDLIEPGESCQLTISPGEHASSEPDEAPTSSIITVEGSNTNRLSSELIILTYGNRYMGGFVFSIDDSKPAIQSVGGKVIATEDQADSTRWGPLFSVDGISEIDQQSELACDGMIDGLCNTKRIVSHYLADPIAAEVCDNLSLEGFEDWYLPAICEMGYDGFGLGSNCGSEEQPRAQNIQSNLFNRSPSIGNLLPVDYWSSTEYSYEPSNSAWSQIYSSGTQLGGIKGSVNAIRCVRRF